MAYLDDGESVDLVGAHNFSGGGKEPAPDTSLEVRYIALDHVFQERVHYVGNLAQVASHTGELIQFPSHRLRGDRLANPSLSM